MVYLYMSLAVFQKDIKKLFNQLKNGANKRGIEFNLSVSDLNELTFPIRCPVLDIPMVFNSGRAQDNSYSIDRIDSSEGYHPDNIVVISHRANTLKRDATLEELQSLVIYYEELANQTLN